MRYANKRMVNRSGNGRFRAAQASDFGIGGTCPNCRHLLIRHYYGDPRDEFPNPMNFKYRCFTCEPLTEAEIALDAEIEAAKPRTPTFGEWLAEAAERIGATAELVTTGAQLCDDNELGTRTIISGGEVFEIREGVSNQQWFENIKPLEY